MTKRERRLAGGMKITKKEYAALAAFAITDTLRRDTFNSLFEESNKMNFGGVPHSGSILKPSSHTDVEDDGLLLGRGHQNCG